jgi:hypothetical protein
MRQILCNQCQAHAALNEYGLSPCGWITIQRQQAIFVPPIDCCGLQCAIAVLERLRVDEKAAIGG